MKAFVPSFYAAALAGLVAVSTPGLHAAETLFVEAESLKSHGGWALDTSFTQIMGSPYLLAHGLGKPVGDAAGSVRVSEGGSYRVWVRTKDWVAPWKAPGTPGRFQLLVNGSALKAEFGTVGAEWHWQSGGVVELKPGEASLALHDLTDSPQQRCLLYAARGGSPRGGPQKMAQPRGRLSRCRRV